MGTKANPAPNDCYAKAEPDEPMFTLLARDPVAPFLVSAWAMLRMGAYTQARTAMEAAIGASMNQPRKLNDASKAEEAAVCAQAMLDWKRPA